MNRLLIATAALALVATAPTPAAAQADPKVIAELKAKLDTIAAELPKATEASKKADEEAKDAAAAFAEIKRVAMLGRVRAGAIEAAEAKATEAQAAAEKAKAKVKELETAAAEIKAKLDKLAPPPPPAPQLDSGRG
jgi:DNA repair exonuclease SbcCD ATPase subunit